MAITGAHGPLYTPEAAGSLAIGLAVAGSGAEGLRLRLPLLAGFVLWQPGCAAAHVHPRGATLKRGLAGGARR